MSMVGSLAHFSSYSLIIFCLGDIVHLEAAGRDIVILSSPQLVHDLLNQRSGIYSDRPIVPFAGELVGFGQGLTLSQNGDWHRGVRKMMASQLAPGPVKQFRGKALKFAKGS